LLMLYSQLGLDFCRRAVTRKPIDYSQCLQASLLASLLPALAHALIPSNVARPHLNAIGTRDQLYNVPIKSSPVSVKTYRSLWFYLVAACLTEPSDKVWPDYCYRSLRLVALYTVRALLVYSKLRLMFIVCAAGFGSKGCTQLF
jgi:hypothetical protein